MLEAMPESLFYTLTSASLGFVAAACFAFGTAFLSQRKLVAISKTYWGYNSEYAGAAVSQSVQYLVGAVLLFGAFVAQVVGALAPASSVLALPVWISNPILFVALLTAGLGILAFLACHVLSKVRTAQVIAVLQAAAK